MTEPPGCSRLRALALISSACVLAMATWFSATAVLAQVVAAYGLAPELRGWITSAVQLGFVVGTMGAALVALPDFIRPRTLIRLGMLTAALANAAIVLVHSVPLLLALRFLTGAGLALVYPPAVKLLSAWFSRDRGLATGVLIGALTFGSFSPHLLAGIDLPWRVVLLGSSMLALVAIPIISLVPPPASASITRFDLHAVPRVLSDRAVLLADGGYWGHMWELYAAWAWAPVFLQASLSVAGIAAPPGVAIFVAFGVFGAAGCVAAGMVADRLGRSFVASAAMVVSGLTSLLIGFAFGADAWLVVALLCVWGFSIVADSAQFSAAVTELADQAYVGTALTLQMSVGFLITMATIWLIGYIEPVVGWRYAFAVLAIGPALGTASMLALRQRPAALKMASGRR